MLHVAGDLPRRRPLLLHATGDAAWFSGDRVLGSLSRVRVAPDAPPTPRTDSQCGVVRELEIRPCPALPAGLAGPAIVEEVDTTVLVPPGWRATLGPDSSIVMQREAA